MLRQGLFRSLRHRFDPFDREILERAFESTWSAVKDGDSSLDFDSDESLELILRRELIEIACFSGAPSGCYLAQQGTKMAVEEFAMERRKRAYRVSMSRR